MAVNRRTLQLLHQLSVTVGTETDEATRRIAVAWVQAWNELAPAWQAAIAELVERAAATGVWPPLWQLARMQRLAAATLATGQTISALSTQAGVTITAGTGAVVAATAAAEPLIIAAQLPAALAETAAARYAARILPQALDVIVARTAEQITSLTRPLADEASEAVRRALVYGVAVGDNPNTVGRDMLRRVEGAFNGGLTRALTIARTEMLDAYRETSRYAHTVNADVLDGWIWHSELKRGRTCVSCWAMHNTVFPGDEPGPLDHPSGRCARLPKVKSWRDLGINLDEPDDLAADARTVFDALPEAEQTAIMGPARLKLLRAGRITWSDLAVRRDNPGWRPSYMPRTVRDLNRIATRRAT